ncbi:MAG: DUF3786 domain-containing protein [Deltaproteobacteria bacterium]|nr:DUF3786 domain-containing protein [Deltaproteobacteria bacterium]MBW2341688.1 DUF3786 domain-containing protein [Deltaproteobacteria bacterium]
MPRVDDYNMALDITEKELRKRNPVHVCRLSGALFTEKEGEQALIRLGFLNRTISITWPHLLFSQDSNKELPIKERIIILHYLNKVNREDPAGEWIAYQDIPSARFYLDAFNRRVKYPLVSAFGEKPDNLLLFAEELYAATTGSVGDVSVLIQALPKIPVTLTIWKGDEEFSPDGAILFDSSIKDILSAEDISELASMIVYPLLAKVR